VEFFNYEPEGREFESLRARHLFNSLSRITETPEGQIEVTVIAPVSPNRLPAYPQTQRRLSILLLLLASSHTR